MKLNFEWEDMEKFDDIPEFYNEYLKEFPDHEDKREFLMGIYKNL